MHNADDESSKERRAGVVGFLLLLLVGTGLVLFILLIVGTCCVAFVQNSQQLSTRIVLGEGLDCRNNADDKKFKVTECLRDGLHA